MNLIPDKPGSTPSYYCTWGAQNNIDDTGRKLNPVKFEGDQGAQLARHNLNDEVLFGKNGLALQYEKIREDLFFVLDDGWDVPYNVHPDTQRYKFGSLLLNEERFPSCSGTPHVRLAKINERMKALGWKGAGLWVASQAQGEHENNILSKEQTINYWTERMHWCRQANIGYWKVDWGLHADSIEFRRMLNKLGKEIYPELLIEHCRCMRPVNGANGRFDKWDIVADEAYNIFNFSDIFRSYDVTSHLSAATTIDRLSCLLQKKISDNSLGIINSEDELYIGAALGCSLGVMRSELKKQHNLLYNVIKKTNEVIRAVRWQKIAPAFGVAMSKVYISDDIGFDSWHFNPGDTWASELINTEVKQGAPIALTRGLPLPCFYEVKDKAPFVVAAKNPNGAASIATLPRTSVNRMETPLCGISLNAGDINCPIGIFGHYGQLTLVFDQSIADKKVFAQDLAGYTAHDITNLVTINNNQLIISGGLIDKVGLSDATEDDSSEPGLVLVIGNL